MAWRWRLGLVLAWGMAGCTGSLIPGVPLEDDDGDGLSVEDAAVTAVEPEQRPRDGGSSETTKPSADARTEQDPGPRPSEDAAAPADAGRSRNRDAGSAPRADASAPVADAGLKDPETADASAPSTRDLGSDKSRFFGAARCDRAGALLCDDFESEAAGAGPDPAVWSAPYGNPPRIDTTRAARGTKSLYFELAAGTPGPIEEKKTFPIANNTVFGRMFVWIDALPTAPAYAHWTLVNGLGSDLPTEVRLGGQLDPNRGNANYFVVGSDHGESGDWSTAGQEPLSKARAGEWTCVEWLFKGDSSETRVWIDGVEQSSLHLTASEYRAGDAEAGKRFVHPRFDKLRIGWWLYQSGAVPSPAKLWIDEVIVDDERIGCAL